MEQNYVTVTVCIRASEQQQLRWLNQRELHSHKNSRLIDCQMEIPMGTGIQWEYHGNGNKTPTWGWE